MPRSKHIQDLLIGWLKYVSFDLLQHTSDPPEKGQLLGIIKQRIENRYRQKSEKQTQRLSTDNQNSDRPIRGRTRTAAQDQREHPGHEGDRCHQDWTKPVAVRTNDRVVTIHPLGPKSIRMVDLEDGVFLYDTEQQQNS